MDFNNFEETIKESLQKLKLSDNNIKGQAFDILNEGFRSMETDEAKSIEINYIISNNREKGRLGDYCLEDIIKFIQFAEKIEPTKEYYKKLEELEPEVPKDKWGVHETHCCSIHGCKYGNSKCPVVTGKIKQKYPCEFCDDDEFEKLCKNNNKK